MNCEEIRRSAWGVCERVSARMEPINAGKGVADTAGATPACASAHTEHE